jgi:hypothetical protein
VTAPQGWGGAAWIAGRQLRSPKLSLGGSEKIQQATVAVTGLGFYELRLNGKKVGDAELDPGFSTNYTERVLYAVHDVTAAVQNASTTGGKVVLAARVGAGKYSMAASHSNAITNNSVFALLCHLTVMLSDGSNRTLVTSDKWQVSAPPFISEHLYHGEVYDARLALLGWDEVAYDPPATSWSAASVIQPPLGADVVLSPRLFPPIRVVKVVALVNVTQLHTVSLDLPARLAPPCPSYWLQSGAVCEQMCSNNAQSRDKSGRCLCGKAAPDQFCSPGFKCAHGACSVPTDPTGNTSSSSWMYDLGNNFAGVPRITLPSGASAGHVMTLAVTEYPAEASTPGRGTTYGQQDQYIFSGDERPQEQYRPTFIYHGFRYIRVDNFPGTAEEAVTAVVGLFMHSDVAPHGNLTIDQRTSAGQILAAVHAAVVQTQACNIYSVPTDCPQREKRGWMGDAQWTAEEAILNFDMTGRTVCKGTRACSFRNRKVGNPAGRDQL